MMMVLVNVVMMVATTVTFCRRNGALPLMRIKPPSPA
jgi:hypothetical protein